MKNILVSIIIPTYNRVNLLGETLDSILNQTYTNWECIVVDDGSIDETEKLLTVYCEKDSRFQYHHRPNDRPKGANACRNYGFELCKGEYIKWLDSDDLLSSDIILSQVVILNKYPKNKSIVVTAKWNYFDDSIVDIKPKIKEINKNYETGFALLFDFGVYNTFLPSHVYLMHKNIIIKSGLWNEHLLINQDGEFFTRILLNADNIVHAEKGMVYYRYLSNRSENVSNISNVEKAKDSILSWVLIDTYLKVYTKEKNSIKYVKNAKTILLKNIKEKNILKENSYFLKNNNQKALNNKIKDILLRLKKRILKYRKLNE